MAKEKVCFQKAKPGWLFFDGYCYKRGCELLINLKSLWSKINPLNLKKCFWFQETLKVKVMCSAFQPHYPIFEWTLSQRRSATTKLCNDGPGVIGATPHTHTQTHRGAISESDCIHKLHVKLRVFTMRCGPDFEAEDNTHSYSRDWSMIYFIFLFDSNGDHNSPSE